VIQSSALREVEATVRVSTEQTEVDDRLEQVGLPSHADTDNRLSEDTAHRPKIITRLAEGTTHQIEPITSAALLREKIKESVS